MSEPFGRVAVLMGGSSNEREISLLGGTAVLESLQRGGVEVVGIDATANLLNELTQQNIQRVFIMLHGRDGEDGKVQESLERIGVAYTGSGVHASEIAMDKMVCKEHWLKQGLSTPDYYRLNDESNWEEIMAVLGTAFVKPAKEGSSIGMTKVSTSVELYKAYEKAKEYDQDVIAERWINGPEFTVAILNGEVLPAIELKTKNEFYDYEAKYESIDTEYICPCTLSDNKRQELEDLAKNAFDTIECYGWGRVDVMQDYAGTFWLLEVNTVPGMTRQSLVPMAAKQAGIEFDELTIKVLETSNDVRRGIK